MPLTTRDQFKVNLLTTIADYGLTIKEARELVQAMTKNLSDLREEKNADFKDIPLVGSVGHLFNKATDVGASAAEKLINSVIGYGLPVAALGPFAAGGIGGYLATKATDIDDDDVAAQKKRELIDLYNAEAAHLSRR